MKHLHPSLYWCGNRVTVGSGGALGSQEAPGKTNNYYSELLTKSDQSLQHSRIHSRQWNLFSSSFSNSQLFSTRGETLENQRQENHKGRPQKDHKRQQERDEKGAHNDDGCGSHYDVFVIFCKDVLLLLCYVKSCSKKSILTIEEVCKKRKSN